MPSGFGYGVTPEGRNGGPNETVPAQSQRPRRKDLLKSFLTVKVGPMTGDKDCQEEFCVHTDLLCHYSPFFKAATSGNWTEAKTGVVNLPYDEPRIFEIFQGYIYAGSLDLRAEQASDASLLVALWVFADKLQFPGLQNQAIEALRRQQACTSPREFRLKDIQYAFDNTTEASPLRKFIIDLYVWEALIVGSISGWLEDGYPRAFIVGVVEGYCQQFPRPGLKTLLAKRPYTTNAGLYHMRDEVMAPGP
ncbi:MAG: hypothetical protein Q9174_000807 [Haloplaca sp. 1 TL-2023]